MKLKSKTKSLRFWGQEVKFGFSTFTVTINGALKVGWVTPKLCYSVRNDFWCENSFCKSWFATMKTSFAESGISYNVNCHKKLLLKKVPENEDSRISADTSHTLNNFSLLKSFKNVFNDPRSQVSIVCHILLMSKCWNAHLQANLAGHLYWARVRKSEWLKGVKGGFPGSGSTSINQSTARRKQKCRMSCSSQ